MLPRAQRVPKKLFSVVLQRGKSAHSSHFSLRIMPTTEAPQGRISVIVPKKVSARAVTRNSLRRRVYSLIRAEVDIPQDVAILVFVKKDFARPDRPNIQAELQTLFKNF